MRNGTGLRVVLWLAVAGALSPMPLHLKAAVLQSASERVPRVSLAEVSTTPGASLMVPLVLTPDPENPLRSLTVDIEFVSKSLIFQKTSPGMALELVNADIQANLTEGEPDDKGLKRAKLRVAASLPESNPKEGLPEGLLAYLLFQVSQDAKPVMIKLTPTVVSAEDLSTPPKKVASLAAEPGLVVVEALDTMYERLAPFACFFFMH
ncbi:hypothetical protein MYX82_09755 [Acidobacteria bacterium AH-259-D05]|nr:hypothetical protein [Acidobacteria bacterium AH-259-D05]